MRRGLRPIRCCSIPRKFPPYLAPPVGITTRAQRGIRTLSPPKKLTFEDVKAGKLSTHVETADQFVDDLHRRRPQTGHGSRRRKPPMYSRNGTARRITTATARCCSTASCWARGTNFRAIGGYAIPSDEHQPLDTPRGFADPAKSGQRARYRRRRHARAIRKPAREMGRRAPPAPRLVGPAGQRRAFDDGRNPDRRSRPVCQRQNRRRLAATPTSR